jgi:hypothetical protein
MPERGATGDGKTGVGKTRLHEGLKTRSPEPPSGKFTKGGSVNDGATRDSTAKTPGSLGPREA